MALTRTRPIQAGFPTALDDRKLEAGVVVREGVFPSPTTLANNGAGIVSAGAGWALQAAPFVAATKRGTSAFGLTYGTAYVANDSQVAAAWTIPAAPGSGSRYDRLWVRVTDPDQGDATSGSDGPAGAARAVPVFGVTSGVAGTTPSLPALPAGVLEIAQALTASTATSAAQSTVAHVHAFAQLVGGRVYARTLAELNAITSALPGDIGIRLDAPTIEYRFSGTAWLANTVTTTTRSRTTPYNLTNAAGAVDFNNADETPASPDFNYAASTFTCLRAGRYLIVGMLNVSTAGAAVGFLFRAAVNGAPVAESTNVSSTVGGVATPLSKVVTLAVNDTVQFVTYANSAIGASNNPGNFYGQLSRLSA